MSVRNTESTSKLGVHYFMKNIALVFHHCMQKKVQETNYILFRFERLFRVQLIETIPRIDSQTIGLTVSNRFCFCFTFPFHEHKHA